jgi:enamine deaminase RidA (YjgF/YER057c/UK114 family)
MNQPLNPTDLHPPFGHYAHGIKTAGQGILVTSGQLGVAADGTVPADPASQARICFGNIAAILAEGGLSLSNVVRLNAFVTDRPHGRLDDGSR